jgi:UDP-glucuronate 4-epimerase
VGDLVEAVTRLMAAPPATGRPAGAMDSLSPVAPWRVVNIAGGQPVELMAFIAEIEKALGKTAGKRMLPMQAGDAERTEADPALLEALIGKLRWTPIEEWVAAFVDWYRTTWSPG